MLKLLCLLCVHYPTACSLKSFQLCNGDVINTFKWHYIRELSPAAVRREADSVFDFSELYNSHVFQEFHFTLFPHYLKWNIVLKRPFIGLKIKFRFQAFLRQITGSKLSCSFIMKLLHRECKLESHDFKNQEHTGRDDKAKTNPKPST